MSKINDAGRIEDLTYGEFFNVQLHNGDNPAIELTVDFTGMPIETLVKLAYDTMKVKFRPHVKGMQTETFIKTFKSIFCVLIGFDFKLFVIAHCDFKRFSHIDIIFNYCYFHY